MSTQNLVHEADSQRHHVRVKLPAKMQFNDTIFAVEDWSTAGARVLLGNEQASKIISNGQVHSVIFMFDFAGFTFSVPMRVESRHDDKADKGSKTGLRFVDMTQEQIVIMQQLVNSYVTGELSSVGDILNVVSRNNFTKPRQLPKKEDETTAQKAASLARMAAIYLVSFLLFSYIALSIFDRTYLISADRAFVTAEGLAVTSPSGGIVSLRKVQNGATVKKGDVLASVQSPTGTVVGVDSPCDCIIQEIIAVTGTTADRGTVLMRMTPVDSPLFIQAFVNFNNATRLRNGQIVDVELANSDVIKAKIENVSVRLDSDLTSVLVKPDTKIPSEMLGLPVKVRVNTFAWALGR